MKMQFGGAKPYLGLLRYLDQIYYAAGNSISGILALLIERVLVRCSGIEKTHF